MFVIKRTEEYDGGTYIDYMNEDGWFNTTKDKARRFLEKEDAEEYVESEKSDPKYKQKYMGVCTFEIEEV